MAPVFLKRYDPEARINRWYRVAIQPTLLDPVAVICSWGSLSTSFMQARIIPMDSFDHARKTAQAIVESKKKRGYWVAHD